MKINKKELEDIAKAFCKKAEVTLLYVNEFEIGYETKQGFMTHKSWEDIANILKEMEE